MFTKQIITFSAIGAVCNTQKQCDVCNKLLDTHDDWVNHFLYVHPPIKKCPKCEENMKYEDFCVNPKEEWMIYKCECCGFLGESWKVL